jgi:four helix bundle protein
MAEHQRQDLKARTFAFSAALLSNFKALAAGGAQYDHMARQVFAAGTSIGAMVEEAEVALSRRDFAAKYVIALREARESNYWLRLFATQPSHLQLVRPLVCESGEFVAILTTSVKKLRASPVP